MKQRVLILIPSVGILSLEEEAYRRALEEGSRFSSPHKSSEDPNERLLDSQQLADVLQIPVTWIEQQAREGNIPSLSFGRRRRYRRSSVEAAIKQVNVSIDPL
jgi:excisionase family DNA binding protein